MRHRALPPGDVRLERGVFDDRRELNRRYLSSLTVENLLQNHFVEAGIGDQSWHLRIGEGPGLHDGRGRHWGWETPGGQLRGHFLGHWLSGAAREVAVTGDAALSATLQSVLAGLERCQQENGGQWIWAIPPRFLDRLAAGLEIWAPQYTMHKVLMGLVDVHTDLGDERALRLALAASERIDDWSSRFDTEHFQRMLDVETGGMLEVWADLLAITGDERYARLLQRYRRAEFFDALVAGRDVLTNVHANTTIPEVLGAARAWEVTGDPVWRQAVEAYWKSAVTDRGTFCTGGQTSGEIWTPPFEFAARRGEKTQEHCTVHNMIRLADVMFRWTGEIEHLEYVERNLHNGILAQQHPTTGMVAYFLPLEGGARKHWGSPTDDFWCCHGTLVQAHTRHSSLVCYTAEDGAVVVAQFIPSTAQLTVDGNPVTVTTALGGAAARVGPDANAGPAGSRHRPRHWAASVTITSEHPATVRIRVPAWIDGPATVHVAGSRTEHGPGFLDVRHEGGTTVVGLTLPTALRTVAIPDEPGTVAFLDGPVVLAGLIDHERTLVGDPAHPELLLVPDDERQWAQWLPGYRTVGQRRALRFVPLHDVRDEPYSVYFPLEPAGPAAQEPVSG